ncbi:hypothetical protein TNIN_156521 [Trichonephila inaurata madagascariensis]|uniref:Uncharacterized protein n=1 Tax=Trichonephila inaurata madagascariensis TaxID=2747483 RepID=A0A8X7BRT4_9ARAC|nr:hypothetical protein TNIN_156521 [Trichonephila inaurata madagascariensis]
MASVPHSEEMILDAVAANTLLDPSIKFLSNLLHCGPSIRFEGRTHARFSLANQRGAVDFQYTKNCRGVWIRGELDELALFKEAFATSNQHVSVVWSADSGAVACFGRSSRTSR